MAMMAMTTSSSISVNPREMLERKPLRERSPRHSDALSVPEPQVRPLTPALSPSEGERGNRRQLSGEPRFRGRLGPMPADFRTLPGSIGVFIVAKGAPIRSRWFSAAARNSWPRRGRAFLCLRIRGSSTSGVMRRAWREIPPPAQGILDDNGAAIFIRHSGCSSVRDYPVPGGVCNASNHLYCSRQARGWSAACSARLSPRRARRDPSQGRAGGSLLFLDCSSSLGPFGSCSPGAFRAAVAGR